MISVKLNLCLPSSRVRLEKLLGGKFFFVFRQDWSGKQQLRLWEKLSQEARRTHQKLCSGMRGHPTTAASLVPLAQQGLNYDQKATLASPVPNFWALFILANTLAALLFVVNSFYIQHCRKNRNMLLLIPDTLSLDTVTRHRKLSPASIGYRITQC